MNYQNSLPLSTLPIFRARNTALVGQKREGKGKGKKESNKQTKKGGKRKEKERKKKDSRIFTLRITTTLHDVLLSVK